MALQVQAGGTVDGPLAIPQLASVAALARKLNLLVSRPVIAASDHSDISLWVRAKPLGDEVHIAAIDWVERPVDPQEAERRDGRQLDLAEMAPGWMWQVDPDMRFVAAMSDTDEPYALPQVGQGFTHWFRLTEGDDGAMPIMAAILARRIFRDQAAVMRSDPDIAFRLAGIPLLDASGRLIGYRGRAERVDLHAANPAVDGVDDLTAQSGHAFGRHLDRALRLPLGRIIANAETIGGQLEGPLRADYASYASDIAGAARHLMALVDDLADLRAVERPGFTTAEEPIDLADIARRAAGLLRVRAADRHIRIDAPPEGEMLAATGEFRRALQVMVNLIGNAVRYSPAGSSIWVRADIMDGRPTLVVADQGPGIAAEDQARIFEKFERLGRAEDGGSGLGLYISRLLARAMGGDIIVESAPGQGARFAFSLPPGR